LAVPFSDEVGKTADQLQRIQNCVANRSESSWITQLAKHSFRHTYRNRLDAVGGTPITVQQKLMWHSDISTTLNIHGDVVTDEMQGAESKIAGLALRSDSKLIPPPATY
jgi:integrase